MGTAGVYFLFDIDPMVDFAREEHLSVPNAGKARHMAPFVDTHGHLLSMLFAFPEQFDGKWRSFDHFGSPIPQQLAGFRGVTWHQWMPILIDHIHQNLRHSVKLSFQSKMLLAEVQ
jgi:hypothetical protein